MICARVLVETEPENGMDQSKIQFLDNSLGETTLLFPINSKEIGVPNKSQIVLNSYACMDRHTICWRSDLREKKDGYVFLYFD